MVAIFAFSSCEKVEEDFVPEEKITVEAYTVEGGLLKVNAEKAEELKLVFLYTFTGDNVYSTPYQRAVGNNVEEKNGEDYSIKADVVIVYRLFSGYYPTCLSGESMLEAKDTVFVN